MALAENFRLQCLDWFAVRPAKPCCVDEKDLLKGERQCSGRHARFRRSVPLPMILVCFFDQ